MTRPEIEDELTELRAQIARLQGREAFLATRLAQSDAEEDGHLPRPGWPIARAQTSGRRISTASPSRIAV